MLCTPTRRGEKAETRKLSYSDCYRAASSYSCEFASIIVNLLNLVRSLSKRNLLQVPDSAWSEPVSYDEADKSDQEQIVTGSAYIFPIGTKIPTGANPEDIPGARKATLAVLYRLQHPESSATVISFDASQRPTSCYEAIYGSKDGVLMFRIDDIGDLIVSKEAMAQGGRPVGSISFAASESHQSEVHDFLASIAPPNILGLKFIFEGKPMFAFLQLSKCIEAAMK